MRKHISILLVFLFSMQICTPSFAQSNGQAEIQGLRKCLDRNFSAISAVVPESSLEKSIAQNRLQFSKFMATETLNAYLYQKEKHINSIYNLGETMVKISLVAYLLSSTFISQQSVVDTLKTRWMEQISRLRETEPHLTIIDLEETALSYDRAIQKFGRFSRFSARAGFISLFTVVLVGATYLKTLQELNKFSPHYEEIYSAPSEAALFETLSSDGDLIQDFLSFFLKVCNNIDTQKAVADMDQFIKTPPDLEKELIKTFNEKWVDNNGDTIPVLIKFYEIKDKK